MATLEEVEEILYQQSHEFTTSILEDYRNEIRDAETTLHKLLLVNDRTTAMQKKIIKLKKFREVQNG